MLNILMVFSLFISHAFSQHFELETKILGPSKIIQLIGPFPEKGSLAEAQDFNVLLKYQQTRTAEDCALAASDMETSVKAMFGGNTGILSDDEVKKMEKFLIKAMASAGANAYIAKSIYKRERPYEANKKIRPCIDEEKSHAYPSGHTIIARLYGRILSKVYPERSEKFMARATEYSLNRVLGGVHHPTDIAAGNIIADYLALKMVDVDDFVGVE
jgi:acid phosphatase (class A)